MSTKPKLLVTAALPDQAIALYQRYFQVVHDLSKRRYSASDIVQQSVGAVAMLVMATDRIDSILIRRLPGSVKVIATYSIGTEHIDLQAAKECGIAVVNAPDTLSESCADIAFLLMLGAARRAVEGIELIRTGDWDGWHPAQLIGKDVHGQRLGIYGMGRIGRKVAKRAMGFDMQVHYHNRSQLPAELELGAQYHDDLHALLAVSDFLCIACPGGPETRDTIDEDAIGQLPDWAVVTNISRGDIIQDSALIAALKTGKVAAAGLDVFTNEPFINPEYRTLPNVFGLPHIGSATSATRVRMAEGVLRRLLDRIKVD
ncbi:D-glycerate dehydrogenase [Pseudomonas sp. A2]|uniref:2-hydroxyacid dehydrogenase n=1 Tax=Pseudomonas sp. A2 TaxID=107445 RepID=UPI002CB69249|nr:D-glycerate dehydrogenase [Pseudomonas sp. A2]MEB3438088.1 D-glycerate dehydrogenase [Pseudomonas sp. A2]